MASANIQQFARERHIEFIKTQESSKSLEYWLSEHLRLNGLYWGVTAMLTMNAPSDSLDLLKVVEFVLSCWDDTIGGFGAFPQHDAHILSTLSGLQVLLMYDQSMSVLDAIKRKRLVTFIESLQLPDGSFQGDFTGEVDTRFSYTALSSLSILGALTNEVVDRAVDFISRCQNFDGGFGIIPGSESHAAQVFTSVGSLAICDRLDSLGENEIKLASWLSERQVLPSGGFNGRPEKLPDVCYSWWVLSSLAILGKKHWVDVRKLESFILNCQDIQHGGISDRPDNQADIFHTCFGITGLSLVDHGKYGLKEIDPIYCMPIETTKHLVKWAKN